MNKAARYVLISALLIFGTGYSGHADSASPCQVAANSYDRGDFDRAIAGYTECIEARSTTSADLVDAYFRRGLSRSKAGNEEAAIQDFNEAIGLDPDHAAAYGNRGYVFYTTGQPMRAIDDYNLTIEMGGDYAERMYYYRGLAQYRVANHDAAIQDFNQALAFGANETFRVHFDRGLAYFTKGDDDRALQDFDAAILLKSDFAHPYLYRAVIRARMDEHELALLDLDRVLQLDPDHTATKIERCRIQRLMGRTGEMPASCDNLPITSSSPRTAASASSPAGLQIGSLSGSDLFSFGFGALMISLIVLFWPHRRRRRLTFQRLIDAPRERVWELYRIDSGNQDSVQFHDTTVAVRAVSPGITEIEVDVSGGHGTHIASVRFETVESCRPHRLATRTLQVDGEANPDNLETLELEHREGATALALSWQGETKTLWYVGYLWRHYRRFLSRLQQSCETGEIVPSSKFRRSAIKNLALSALTLGSFALWLGWWAAVLLVVIIMLHELGHWIAMRLTGQPAPRIALVPFFGGVAVPNHPHRSRFDDAFCALMGPGFSALLCAALAFIGAQALDRALLVEFGGHGLELLLAAIFLSFAALTAILNAFQLLPILPLDGGHVIRATIQSLTGRWARRVLLAVAGLGIAAAVYFGAYFIAALLCLGGLQAWYMKSESSDVRPMSPTELVAVGSGYGAALAVHIGVVLYSAERLGLDLFGIAATTPMTSS